MAEIAERTRPMSGAGSRIAGQSQTLEQAAYEGPRTVSERDSYRPEFAEEKESEFGSGRPAPFANWPATAQQHPPMFKPNGSFQSLRDGGKLADKQMTLTQQQAALRDQGRSKHYNLPGYTGFVRGMQHISGRTYGEATRRAFDTNYREHASTSPIPSDPNRNRKVPQVNPPNSFATHVHGDKVYNLPGYTGFVPGVRHTYAKTYGSATSEEMFKSAIRDPRPSPKETEGFAYTSKPRQRLLLDSSPLPGQAATNTAPGKLIPSHLNFVRYFPI